MRRVLRLAGPCLLVMGWHSFAGAESPLADLRLPTKNYINNGGFERGEEAWEFFAGQRFGGVVKEEKHSGQACFKATGLIDDYRYFRQPSVPLTPGRTYTLSAWLKSSAFPRATGHSQVVNIVNYGWTRSADLGPEKPDGDWTKYSVTFQAPPTQEVGGQADYTLVIFWPIKSAGTVWVDDIQIEEGSQATDFTECFLSWAFDALAVLRGVHEQAAEARTSLSTSFNAFPIAKTLDAKADAILERTKAIGDRLKAYDTLSASQAQALRKEAEDLKKEVASLKFIYFLGNPYLPLNEVALPSAPPGELKVVWACLSGEQRAVAINVANLTGRSAVARVVPGELTDATRGIRVVGVSWVTAYSVPPIRGHVKPAALFTDPMPRADEAGGFFIGDVGISQAVLVFDSSSLLPGDYRGSVEVASLTDADDRHQLGVSLTVVSVRLPSISDKDISDVGTMADYALDSIGPLSISTFSIPAQWLVPEFDPTGKGDVRVDFSRIAPLVRRYLQRRPDARFFFAFGVGAVISDYLKKTYGLSSDTPLFKVFAANWVKAVVKQFAALGVGPERLIFETVDEPGFGQLGEAATWAQTIKAVEPKVQTQTYVTSLNVPTPSSQGVEYQRLYETHDIIAPGFTFVNEKTVDYLRKLGKKVWVYDCQNNGETFHPIAYYRLLPWLAWRYKLDGWGHFSWLNSERGRNYEPWEGVAEQSLVYPDLSGGQVISRRWLALLAGTQDYQALRALNRLTALAKRKNLSPTVVAKAETLLADLPSKALALLKPDRQYFTGLAPGADPLLLDQFREQIASCVAKLGAAFGPTTINMPITLRQAGGKALLSVSLPQPGELTVRYLCDGQLPWRSVSTRLLAGRSEVPLLCSPGQRINRCFVEVTDDSGSVTVVSPFRLLKVEVDSTVPPYNPNRLNDGLIMPGMKFEPEHGWISGGAATEHWVIASLEKPARISGVRLWWMTFYGLPQAYKVQVWADNAWKDAQGFADWHAARAAEEEIGFDAVTADRVRILQKAGGGNKAFPNLMGLSEVEVF